MHLYVALMTASICVMSILAQKNNYAEYRALVLVQRNGLHSEPAFHRPTSVKRRKHTDDVKSPYKYEVEWKISSMMSKAYFFCPPDKGTKLLYKNKNAECEYPIRTKFIYGLSTLFGNTGGMLVFNEYSYTKHEIEKHEELSLHSGADGSTNIYSDSVYGFVYNYKKKRILYVQYTIYSRDLLDSYEILTQEKDFITEPISLIEESGFELVEEILGDMKTEMKHFPLEGTVQISDSSYDYYRATLASRFHFPLVQYKRPLFHYSNITLVHKDILELFVETQKFISEIKMNELRIFAVPYFHSEKKDTQKEGNEKSREKYAPDIIGYLIFDKEEKQGIAIILHNESALDKDQIEPICGVMECKSYREHLIKKGVNENILRYAYCCNINRMLSDSKFYDLFSGNNILKLKYDDLNIQV